MRLGVAGDLLFPTGDFGDVVSTGFGATVWLEYPSTPMFSFIGQVGYYNWSGKDITINIPPFGTTTISGPDVDGLSLRVGGRYYFTPKGGTRVYGQGELGLLFASVDFAIAPVVGIVYPLSPTLDLDVSGRYDIIATSGSSSTSLGIRAGVSFGLN
jgi:hypothetical protein